MLYCSTGFVQILEKYGKPQSEFCTNPVVLVSTEMSAINDKLLTPPTTIIMSLITFSVESIHPQTGYAAGVQGTLPHTCTEDEI